MSVWLQDDEATPRSWPRDLGRGQKINLETRQRTKNQFRDLGRGQKINLEAELWPRGLHHCFKLKFVWKICKMNLCSQTFQALLQKHVSIGDWERAAVTGLSNKRRDCCRKISCESGTLSRVGGSHGPGQFVGNSSYDWRTIELRYLHEQNPAYHW